MEELGRLGLDGPILEKFLRPFFSGVFLDPALVRYVMIHELCHTKEMNHAPRFWRLVQTECPDFRALNKTLRQAWNTVPSWACNEQRQLHYFRRR